MKHIKEIEMKVVPIIMSSNSHDNAHEAHSTPFLIFFGLTCALIGAIAYKLAAALL